MRGEMFLIGRLLSGRLSDITISATPVGAGAGEA